MRSFSIRRSLLLVAMVLTPFVRARSQAIRDSAGIQIVDNRSRSVFRTPGPVRTQTMAVATRWDVIDANGRWITTVDLPERFTPVEIGADYVAGPARDEDEVEQVLVYRLRKPDSP
jgi:hypothetical protein